MHTATWLCRDQRLRETCATPPCAPHWLPDAPLSCWVAQLARRQHTSNVELPSPAFVMSWRGVRGGQCLVRPALYLWRWCSDTVCAQSYKHTVCVICSAIRCVLLVRGTEGIVSWRLQVQVVFECVVVLLLNCTVLHRGGFNLVCFAVFAVEHSHGSFHGCAENVILLFVRCQSGSSWFFFCVHHIDATSALMADYMFGQ